MQEKHQCLTSQILLRVNELHGHKNVLKSFVDHRLPPKSQLQRGTVFGTGC